MDRSEYLNEERWRGSFYELCLELGPVGDDATAEHALRSLWSDPSLRGPWSERRDFGAEPHLPAISDEQRAAYGCLALGPTLDVGCASYLIRVDGESDWLDLSIPVGMLELRFPVSYPLESRTNPWMLEVDRLLAGIAARVYDAVPFQLGLLGEEASGSRSASELTSEDCARGGVLVSEELWRQLKPSRKPEWLTRGLAYLPMLGPHITYGG